MAKRVPQFSYSLNLSFNDNTNNVEGHESSSLQYVKLNNDNTIQTNSASPLTLIDSVVPPAVQQVFSHYRISNSSSVNNSLKCVSDTFSDFQKIQHCSILNSTAYSPVISRRKNNALFGINKEIFENKQPLTKELKTKHKKKKYETINKKNSKEIDKRQFCKEEYKTKINNIPSDIANLKHESTSLITNFEGKRKNIGINETVSNRVDGIELISDTNNQLKNSNVEIIDSVVYHECSEHGDDVIQKKQTIQSIYKNMGSENHFKRKQNFCDELQSKSKKKKEEGSSSLTKKMHMKMNTLMENDDIHSESKDDRKALGESHIDDNTRESIGLKNIKSLIDIQSAHDIKNDKKSIAAEKIFVNQSNKNFIECVDNFTNDLSVSLPIDGKGETYYNCENKNNMKNILHTISDISSRKIYPFPIKKNSIDMMKCTIDKDTNQQIIKSHAIQKSNSQIETEETSIQECLEKKSHSIESNDCSTAQLKQSLLRSEDNNDSNKIAKINGQHMGIIIHSDKKNNLKNKIVKEINSFIIKTNLEEHQIKESKLDKMEKTIAVNQSVIQDVFNHSDKVASKSKGVICQRSELVIENVKKSEKVCSNTKQGAIIPHSNHCTEVHLNQSKSEDDKLIINEDPELNNRTSNELGCTTIDEFVTDDTGNPILCQHQDEIANIISIKINAVGKEATDRKNDELKLSENSDEIQKTSLQIIETHPPKVEYGVSFNCKGTGDLHKPITFKEIEVPQTSNANLSQDSLADIISPTPNITKKDKLYNRLKEKQIVQESESFLQMTTVQNMFKPNGDHSTANHINTNLNDLEIENKDPIENNKGNSKSDITTHIEDTSDFQPNEQSILDITSSKTKDTEQIEQENGERELLENDIKNAEHDHKSANRDNAKSINKNNNEKMQILKKKSEVKLNTEMRKSLNSDKASKVKSLQLIASARKQRMSKNKLIQSILIDRLSLIQSPGSEKMELQNGINRVNQETYNRKKQKKLFDVDKNDLSNLGHCHNEEKLSDCKIYEIETLNQKTMLYNQDVKLKINKFKKQSTKYEIGNCKGGTEMSIVEIESELANSTKNIQKSHITEPPTGTQNQINKKEAKKNMLDESVTEEDSISYRYNNLCDPIIKTLHSEEKQTKTASHVIQNVELLNERINEKKKQKKRSNEKNNKDCIDIEYKEKSSNIQLDHTISKILADKCKILFHNSDYGYSEEQKSSESICQSERVINNQKIKDTHEKQKRKTKKKIKLSTLINDTSNYVHSEKEENGKKSRLDVDLDSSEDDSEEEYRQPSFLMSTTENDLIIEKDSYEPKEYSKMQSCVMSSEKHSTTDEDRYDTKNENMKKKSISKFQDENNEVKKSNIVMQSEKIISKNTESNRLTDVVSNYSQSKKKQNNINVVTDINLESSEEDMEDDYKKMQSYVESSENDSTTDEDGYDSKNENMEKNPILKSQDQNKEVKKSNYLMQPEKIISKNTGSNRLTDVLFSNSQFKKKQNNINVVTDINLESSEEDMEDEYKKMQSYVESSENDSTTDEDGYDSKNENMKKNPILKSQDQNKEVKKSNYLMQPEKIISKNTGSNRLTDVVSNYSQSKKKQNNINVVTDINLESSEEDMEDEYKKMQSYVESSENDSTTDEDGYDSKNENMKKQPILISPDQNKEVKKSNNLMQPEKIISKNTASNRLTDVLFSNSQFKKKQNNINIVTDINLESSEEDMEDEYKKMQSYVMSSEEDDGRYDSKNEKTIENPSLKSQDENNEVKKSNILKQPEKFISKKMSTNPKIDVLSYHSHSRKQKQKNMNGDMNLDPSKEDMDDEYRRMQSYVISSEDDSTGYEDNPVCKNEKKKKKSVHKSQDENSKKRSKSSPKCKGNKNDEINSSDMLVQKNKINKKNSRSSSAITLNSSNCNSKKKKITYYSDLESSNEDLEVAYQEMKSSVISDRDSSTEVPSDQYANTNKNSECNKIECNDIDHTNTEFKEAPQLIQLRIGEYSGPKNINMNSSNNRRNLNQNLLDLTSHSHEGKNKTESIKIASIDSNSEKKYEGFENSSVLPETIEYSQSFSFEQNLRNQNDKSSLPINKRKLSNDLSFATSKIINSNPIGITYVDDNICLEPDNRLVMNNEILESPQFSFPTSSSCTENIHRTPSLSFKNDCILSPNYIEGENFTNMKNIDCLKTNHIIDNMNYSKKEGIVNERTSGDNIIIETASETFIANEFRPLTEINITDSDDQSDAENEEIHIREDTQSDTDTFIKQSKLVRDTKLNKEILHVDRIHSINLMQDMSNNKLINEIPKKIQSEFIENEQNTEESAHNIEENMNDCSTEVYRVPSISGNKHTTTSSRKPQSELKELYKTCENQIKKKRSVGGERETKPNKRKHLINKESVSKNNTITKYLKKNETSTSHIRTAKVSNEMNQKIERIPVHFKSLQQHSTDNSLLASESQEHGSYSFADILSQSHTKKMQKEFEEILDETSRPGLNVDSKDQDSHSEYFSNDTFSTPIQNERCDNSDSSLAYSQKKTEIKNVENFPRKDLIGKSKKAMILKLIKESKTILEIKKILIEMDDEDPLIEKIENLTIENPSPLFRIQEIAYSVLKPPNIVQKKKLEEEGIKLKLGFFDDNEDRKIKRNWKHFCEYHDWDENDYLPFIKYFNRSKYDAFSRRQLTSFIQFISHGFENRTMNSVFGRFQRIFSYKEQNDGKRFTEEDDEIIMTYMRTTKRKYPFADIAKILNRKRDAIRRRYQLLEWKRKQTISKICWTKPLAEKFLVILIEVTCSINILELKNRQITPHEWSQVGERMKMPSKSLKRSWLINFYPRLFSKHYSKNLHHVKAKLVDIVSRKYSNWLEVDWEEVSNEIGEGYTQAKCSKILRGLIRNNIPLNKRNNLKEALSCLSIHDFTTRGDNFSFLKKIMKETKNGTILPRITEDESNIL